MQGAIIGFGKIAKGHLTAFERIKEINITAIVEPIKAIRDEIVFIHPNLNVYSNVEELFAKENLDFIDICTPPNTHLQYILFGLNKDCHIICEKPLLININDFQKVLKIQKVKSKIIYPCHNYKFAPIFNHLKNIVQDKHFGKVINGHFRILRSGHAIGTQEWERDWRRNPVISGGGILWDHGPHNIYLALWLNNKIPQAISCIAGNLNKNSYIDTEDTVLMTIQFEENINFKIDLSWAASYRNSYYSIQGNNQSIIIEDTNLIHIKPLEINKFQNFTTEFNDSSHETWFYEMFKDFNTLISNPIDEKKQKYLLQEAYLVSLIIEQAYISAKNAGEKVKLPKLPPSLT